MFRCPGYATTTGRVFPDHLITKGETRGTSAATCLPARHPSLTLRELSRRWVRAEMSAEDAAEALKLARKKQAAGDDAGAMKMAQKSLRIYASDEAQKLVDHIRKFGDDSEMAATARRIIEAADLYAVLQLAHDATPDDVKKAYHRTSKIVHPDKNRSRLSDEAFKRVGEAFNTLKALLVDGDSEAVVLKALGMGGSGKTVLATALARDAEVMGSFWRVLWINVGE